MLLPPNTNYLERETSRKLKRPNKQSSTPSPDCASYQKGKLVIFICWPICHWGRPWVWSVMETKGFSHVHWDLNQKWTSIWPHCSSALWSCCPQIQTRTERAKPDDQGNAPADFHAEAAARESVKVVAHVDKVHSASKKITSYCQTCHPNVLVTWQQSAPESEKLGWANHGCKLNEQSGIWEAQEGPLVLPSPSANSIFWFLHSFPHYGMFKITQIINKLWWGDFYKTSKK